MELTTSCLNYFKHKLDYAFPQLIGRYGLYKLIISDEDERYSYFAILVYPNPNRDNYRKSYWLIPELADPRDQISKVHKDLIESETGIKVNLNVMELNRNDD